MANIDFYYMPESPPCRAIEMVAKIIGVEFNKHYINLATKEHLEDDFVKLNPIHKVPFIVDGNLKINESCAIMIYLINKYKPNGHSLYPNDPVERARVDELLYYSVGTLSPAAGKLLRVYLFGQVKELNSEDDAAYNVVLDYLNKRLGDNNGKRFILGDNLTIADIYLSASFSFPEACGYSIQKYPHLVAYLERMKAAIPNYSEINDKPVENIRMIIKSKQEGK